MRLIRFALAWVVTAVAVFIAAPIANAIVRTPPGADLLLASGGALGEVIPRGRWAGNSRPGTTFAVRIVTPTDSGETGLVAAYDWASCAFGQPTSPPVLVALTSATMFPPMIWWIRRRKDVSTPDAPHTGIGRLAIPVCGAIGLGAWMFELSVRIFWTGAELSLRERSLFHDTTGEHVVGGGWIQLHGDVLALTDLPMWLIRVGVWGLALLVVTAIAGWRPARRPAPAIAWAAGCLTLLASPWWLAVVFGPMWIE